MGIGVSMFLVAAGAIMRFAVTVQGHGFNVHTTGVVLMIVGAIGAVLSIAFWASWGGLGRYHRGVAQRTVVTSQGTPVQSTQQAKRTESEVI
ncbi:MAG: hypothetical protein M0Z82_08225 [Actinomycetota bacterium]|jgi:hypothetical protein|nr:hypothetical protein [Actinomycetota bacterium]